VLDGELDEISWSGTPPRWEAANRLPREAEGRGGRAARLFIDPGDEVVAPVPWLILHVGAAVRALAVAELGHGYVHQLGSAEIVLGGDGRTACDWIALVSIVTDADAVVAVGVFAALGVFAGVWGRIRDAGEILGVETRRAQTIGLLADDHTGSHPAGDPLAGVWRFAIGHGIGARVHLSVMPWRVIGDTHAALRQDQIDEKRRDEPDRGLEEAALLALSGYLAHEPEDTPRRLGA
jgi:hypothetical protein